MDPDTALILGMGLMVLSIPSLIAAWSDGRAPRVAAIVLLAGAGIGYYALRQKEGGYTWSDIPNVLYTFIAQVMNAVL